ncbi:hypothetical protein [Streptomyces sp. NPDC017529]|uniref:hypothetical protein n=1 Tax=Streptomyces sp. NPDC017529 TaxID=3365000 RepID=UPI0037ABDD6F
MLSPASTTVRPDEGAHPTRQVEAARSLLAGHSLWNADQLRRAVACLKAGRDADVLAVAAQAADAVLVKDAPLLPDAEVRRRIVGLKRHLHAVTSLLNNRVSEDSPQVLRLLLKRAELVQQETPAGPMGPTVHMLHLAEAIQQQVRYLRAGPDALNRCPAPPAAVTARLPRHRTGPVTPRPPAPPRAHRRRAGCARRAAGLLRRHPGAAVLTAVVCLPSLYGLGELVTVLRA